MAPITARTMASSVVGPPTINSTSGRTTTAGTGRRNWVRGPRAALTHGDMPMATPSATPRTVAMPSATTVVPSVCATASQNVPSDASVTTSPMVSRAVGIP